MMIGGNFVSRMISDANRRMVSKSKRRAVPTALLLILLSSTALLLLATAAPVAATTTPPVTVTCSPNPVTLGLATTCTATESAGTGSGDTIGWSSTDLGGVFTPTSCQLGGSPVSCSVSYTPSETGTQTITATCGNEIGCATGTGSLDVLAATYSVTFGQTGIPTSGVTWGVTVNSVHHTGTGASIVVSGLSGTVAYSYDTPVSGGPGVEYVCSSGCSGTVSGAGTESATYTIQYSVTFEQTGIPTSGVTWGVTVNSVHYAGTGASIIVSGLTGTVSYSYDSPVSGAPGVQYVCSSDCSGSVSGTGTVSASYATQYSVTYQAAGCVLTVTVSSEWVTSGGSATGVFPSPVSGEGTQCLFVSDNRPETITGPTTITGTYETQYYLTVSSPYGSPSGSGWYNAGSPAGFDVSSPASGGPGTQYVFSVWAGTGAGSYSGSHNPESVTMNNPITETASWITQYSVAYAAADCPLSVTVPSEWVTSGDSATGVFPSLVSQSGTQCVFVSDDRPGTINGPTTITGTYQTQYYLTVSSAYGSPTGAGWYNAGDTPSFGVTSPASGGPGIRSTFLAWTGTGANSYSGPNNPGSVTMDNPITETASWATQYSVTFAVSPPGSGTTSPTGVNQWEDAGSLPISALANPGYGFSTWAASGSITFASSTADSTTATISGPGTITADFGLATVTTVTCIPSPLAVGSTGVCIASVSGGPLPTGQVTFAPSYPGHVAFISTDTCTLVLGSCSVGIIGETPGDLLMGATYGGDSSHGTSSGSAGLIVYQNAGSSVSGSFGNCSEAALPGKVIVTLSDARVGAQIFTTNLGNLGSGTTGLVTVSYYEVQVVGVTDGKAFVCIYSPEVTGNTVMKYYYGGWQLAYPYSFETGKWIGGVIPVAALTEVDLVTFGAPIDPPSTTTSGSPGMGVNVPLATSSMVLHPPRAFLGVRLL